MVTTEATTEHEHGDLHDAVVALVGEDTRFLLIVDDGHDDGLRLVGHRMTWVQVLAVARGLIGDCLDEIHRTMHLSVKG